ncbi:Histone methylation protein DOT1 [Chlamydia poikilotherma]|uniref:Histone methylation protein DOT1 n=1 Tax=Chlamydia poikilotherma TaxID=1967783 RepID=A0A3B0Q8K3_9CHLA|nr:Histone methylation protein DOT1 [Chlamydia poikilotherma]
MSYSNRLKSFAIKKSSFLHVLRVGIHRIVFSIREYVYLFFSLYIKYPKLIVYDLAKFFYSLFRNPYKRLRRSPQSSLLKEGNVYGETPWSVLNKVSREFGVTSQDIVYDLGCGLGKVCFWFSDILKCQVVGIDNQSAFINFASRMHKLLSPQPTIFFKEYFYETELSQASCVYFYGSSYSLKVLKGVLTALAKLKSGNIVITISFSLDSLPDGDTMFVTEKSCDVTFPWGKTKAYKNIRR